MKLPKQFKHWLQAANLRLYRRNRFYKPSLTEFRGRGHHWRINCHGELQCSEPLRTLTAGLTLLLPAHCLKLVHEKSS